MEESIYDMIVSELVKRQQDVKAELHERFKKTKPFRQEPVTKQEMIMDYDELIKNEPLLRNDFGDDAVDVYKLNLESKIRGR